MSRRFGLIAWFLVAVTGALRAGELRVLKQNPDPFGYPRPAPGAINVPVGTSFFIQLGFEDPKSSDAVLPESVVVRLGTPGKEPIELVSAGPTFADGYTGTLTASRKPSSALAINIDGGSGLLPGTVHTVSVEARSRAGAVLNRDDGTWTFTTADNERSHDLSFSVDLTSPPIVWKGAFFSGFCKPSFCTSESNRMSGYELMRSVRVDAPRAWSLQRDFSPTSTGHQPRFLDGAPPNVVRERETRRIVSIEPQESNWLVSVEDFFGHEQYGIPSGRPLADDYHAGDTVLIADGIRDAQGTVVRVVADTRERRTLLVTGCDASPDAWKIEYSGPLPTAEDPRAPGLFPPGGCYLRKLRPCGTPHYYWGRIDKEWDIAVRQFGRRIVVNFADAPGDLAIDGREWTYPKDYVEFHQVVHAYTSHLIERYGDDCLNFVWSIFNEPDLAAVFWRSGDWIELQKFYDYATDAVLRAFEDHGYDSRRVFIGGLEIGAIFGTHIEEPILKKFLCHCSPTATCPGELELNAAFSDERLTGKRSRRVEDLCRTHDGKGSPCDFVSIHAYNTAPRMAAKLRRAKELALELDADYYANLWVNSFESCPDWAPPPDKAADDSYLGSGYFSTWCADVARRGLTAARDDPRFAFGETLLTFWPWPNSDFRGHNDATQVIGVDEDGDGRKDRDEAMPLPILHFLGLVARMSDQYWVLPEQVVGGHIVSGFASRQPDSIMLLVYAHDPHDVQARSKAEFSIDVDIRGMNEPAVEVSEYQFDKDHNSYFQMGRKLRDDAALRAGTLPAGGRFLSRPPGFHPDEVRQVKEQSRLSVTRQSSHLADATGKLRLSLPVMANGANFVLIEKRRPNVVIFLADDQGWGDLSHHGNTNLQTPNLDSLARAGAAFDRFFVCSVCAPTRAEFLTGRYHSRGGVRGVSTGQERLNTDERTIAESFQAAGYATGAFGKWHNGSQWPYHPNARGFEEYYGFTSGHWGEYFNAPLEHNGKFVRGSGFMTDDLTNHAIEFIERHQSRPFFCYLPYNVPHSPYCAPAEYWDRFRDKPITMRSHEGERETVDETRAALAMVENMDWNIGRVLRKLDELSLSDDTIVVYFTDNGPNTFRWNGGMKGRKGSTDEGGLRSPLFVRWPGRIGAGVQVREICGAIDLLPTLTALAGIDRVGDKRLDGRDLSPLLLQTPTDWPERTLFSHWNGRISCRTQQFRLDDRGQLFDMQADPGQSTNVAERHPELAKKLGESVAAWKADVLGDPRAARADDRPYPVGYAEFPMTPLPARDGIPHGKVRRSANAPNCSYFVNWSDINDSITWDIDVRTTGTYDVVLYYTCAERDAGATIEVSFGGQRLEGRVTPPWDPPLITDQDVITRPPVESTMKEFRPLSLGTMRLDEGRGQLTLRATDIPGQRVMDLRLVTLTLRQ